MTFINGARGATATLFCDSLASLYLQMSRSSPAIDKPLPQLSDNSSFLSVLIQYISYSVPLVHA